MTSIGLHHQKERLGGEPGPPHSAFLCVAVREQQSDESTPLKEANTVAWSLLLSLQLEWEGLNQNKMTALQEWAIFKYWTKTEMSERKEHGERMSKIDSEAGALTRKLRTFDLLYVPEVASKSPIVDPSQR